MIFVVVMADETKDKKPPIVQRPPNPNKDKKSKPAPNPNPKPLPKPVKPFFPQKAPDNLKPVSATDIKGLLAYWPLDESRGVDLADVSMFRQQAQLVSGTWVDGVRGSALSFDGKNDFASLGSSANLNFGASKPFTLSVWVATKDDHGTIVSFRNVKRGAPVIDIQISGGKISATIRGNRLESGQAVANGKIMNDGKWHHVSLTRIPDGHIELFLDGKAQSKVRGFNSTDAITTDLRSLGCEQLWIKAKTLYADPYLRGAIDEFCVFDRVLDAQEIAKLAGKQ